MGRGGSVFTGFRLMGGVGEVGVFATERTAEAGEVVVSGI